MRRYWVVTFVIAACDSGLPPDVPPETPRVAAPVARPAPPADAGLDEAWCRSISNGKSCAEIAPDLERLRADIDAYFERQAEIDRLSWVAKDPATSAADRRDACARIHELAPPLSESSAMSLPSECNRP